MPNMPNMPLDDILKRLHTLQAELEEEIERILVEKRKSFRYTVEKGKIRFEQSIKKLQLQHQVSLWTYLRLASVKHLITAPLVYSLFIPMVFLDIMVTTYQHVCFRAYGINRVKRRDYFIIDRQHLLYLNVIEKLNCVYCGYGNGLIQYVREISALTEQYWCPIKHARRTPDPHYLVEKFSDYGDASEYKSRLIQLRKELRNSKTKTSTATQIKM